MLLQPRLAQDVDGREIIEQQGVRTLEDDVDGEVVDLLGIDHRRKVFAIARTGVDLAQDRRDDIVSGQGLAFVEFHALAQFEPPAGGLDNFPRSRERRFKRKVLVTAHQRVEHHVLHALGETVDLGVWIIRDDIAGRGPAQRLRERRGGQRHQDGERGQKGLQTIVHYFLRFRYALVVIFWMQCARI